MLSRLLSRHARIILDGRLYLIQQNIPWDLQQEADDLKDSVLKSDRFIQKLDLRRVLVERGILDKDYEKTLRELKIDLDNYLMHLYKYYDDVDRRKDFKKRIETTKRSINNVHGVIFAHETATAAHSAERARLDFLFAQSCFYENLAPVTDPQVISKLQVAYYRSMPTVAEVRKIARTDPWQSIWRAQKDGAFQYLPLNDFQLSLSMFSNMYDNVAKSMEPPPQHIIDDDDALDGWMIYQSRQSKEKEKNVSPHAETFVVTKDPEKVKQIYASNSPEVQAVQKARMNQMESEGAVKLQDFNDVKTRRAINAGQAAR